jgi:hypothetical protein
MPNKSLIGHYKPLQGLQKKTLVVNYPQQSQLNPNQTATRADIAAFIYQALVNAGKFEAINSPYVP